MTKYVPMAEEDKTIVEVDIFKCCSDNGEYLGNVLIHDPNVPGDGPWFMTVDKKGEHLTFGFGTKAEAIATLSALTRYAEERYEIDIDPTED
jgi:hypothetical protein